MANSSVNGTKNKDVNVEDLSLQIQVLKDDIASLTDTISSFGAAKKDEAAAAAKAKAAEIKDAGFARAAEMQDQTEEFIRTQPATALSLAAGFGFLVGLVITNRR
ncbi:DUF883 C-terminal domain-containing protein [Sulfitobacter sp. S190]|uniref:DUF883 C-terminal domain-containing protein n=1 Tax=Sulfitobacter sp. S190 TaxID=2867022 RepID=UPI0021A4002C|nr:DUF883 C-terminal domain-containing protein [Sulfitobacter sp. S190]UWR22696.1 DUF883 C-terminal domain-containing protein [Sulfitobacter sp. S190]